MVQANSIRAEEKCQTQILLSDVLVLFILKIKVSGAELRVSFYYMRLDFPKKKNSNWNKRLLSSVNKQMKNGKHFLSPYLKLFNNQCKLLLCGPACLLAVIKNGKLPLWSKQIMFKEEEVANNKKREHGKRGRDIENCRKFLQSLCKNLRRNQTIESSWMVFKAHRVQDSLHSHQAKMKV